MGYNVSITKSAVNCMRKGYERIFPLCNYAPWLNDKLFLKYYQLIEKYTLVDKYRCYELWELIEQIKDTDGDILEVGVWRGGTAGLIAAKAKSCGMDKVIYLADTFEGVVKVSRKDTFYKGGEHNDTSEETVKNS